VADWADVVLVTGTALANDTLDGVLSTKPGRKEQLHQPEQLHRKESDGKSPRTLLVA